MPAGVGFIDTVERHRSYPFADRRSLYYRKTLSSHVPTSVVTSVLTSDYLAPMSASSSLPSLGQSQTEARFSPTMSSKSLMQKTMSSAPTEYGHIVHFEGVAMASRQQFLLLVMTDDKVMFFPMSNEFWSSSWTFGARRIQESSIQKTKRLVASPSDPEIKQDQRQTSSFAACLNRVVNTDPVLEFAVSDIDSLDSCSQTLPYFELPNVAAARSKEEEVYGNAHLGMEQPVLLNVFVISFPEFPPPRSLRSAFLIDHRSNLSSSNHPPH